MKHTKEFIEGAKIGVIVGAIVGLIFLFMLMLTGCSTTMNHPSKSSIEQDKYECGLQAERRARTWGGEYPNPVLYRDFTIECLERRGWVKQ